MFFDVVDDVVVVVVVVVVRYTPKIYTLLLIIRGNFSVSLTLIFEHLQILLYGWLCALFQNGGKSFFCFHFRLSSDGA